MQLPERTKKVFLWLLVAVAGAFIATIVSLVITGMLGRLLSGAEGPTPEVTQIHPAEAVVGKNLDIVGKKLNLVEEVLFSKGGTQPHRLPPLHHGDGRLTVTPSDSIALDEYILELKPKKGDVISTGRKVKVHNPVWYKVSAYPNQPHGGLVIGSGSYPAATQIIIEASPYRGWEFVGWFGDAGGHQNPLYLTIRRDVTVGANFNQVITLAPTVTPTPTPMPTPTPLPTATPIPTPPAVPTPGVANTVTTRD